MKTIFLEFSDSFIWGLTSEPKSTFSFRGNDLRLSTGHSFYPFHLYEGDRLVFRIEDDRALIVQQDKNGLERPYKVNGWDHSGRTLVDVTDIVKHEDDKWSLYDDLVYQCKNGDMVITTRKRSITDGKHQAVMIIYRKDGEVKSSSAGKSYPEFDNVRGFLPIDSLVSMVNNMDRFFEIVHEIQHGS